MEKKERYKLPIAVFMILKRGDDILIIKRATTGLMDGFYSIPAGKLDDGEEILPAAMRECKEEVGVDFNEEDIKLVNVQHCQFNEQRWINFFFLTDKWSGEPKICEPHKHSEIKWVNLHSLPENFVPYVKKGLEDYDSHKMYSQFGWK